MGWNHLLFWLSSISHGSVLASTCWHSLSYQKAGRFIWGKVLRLFIPLVFGAFILSPHQVYLERITHGQFSGSFFQWFPRYFEGLDGFGGNFAFTGKHLWYLMLLFMFSLVLLPIFLLLRSKVGKPIVRGIGAFLRIPGIIYLLGFLLALPMAYIAEEPPFGHRDWAGWNMIFYLILFFIGFLIFADERIQKAIIKQRFVSLIVSIALYLMLNRELSSKLVPI